MLNVLTSFGKKMMFEVSKNSTVILTTITVTGVITTTILGIKATPKALSLIDEEVYKRYEASGTDGTFQEWLGLETKAYSWQDRASVLTKKEIAALTWKCYIPTAIMGIVTIGSAIGAHNIHVRRNAALASLYSLTETAFKEYQGKVVETIGKNKELKVRDDIAADHIKQNPIGDAEVIFTGRGETICRDKKSGRYFKSDIDKIRKAEKRINSDLPHERFISLNDFYDEIGLSHVDLGEDVGWDIMKGALDITFSAQLTENDEPCIVLNYDVVPRYM